MFTSYKEIDLPEFKYCLYECSSFVNIDIIIVTKFITNFEYPVWIINIILQSNSVICKISLCKLVQINIEFSSEQILYLLIIIIPLILIRKSCGEINIGSYSGIKSCIEIEFLCID